MKNKNLVRTVVLAALFAWPAVECYRYITAVQELQASAERVSNVSVKLASARSTQVASKPVQPPKP